ncbi:uncharacterized protein MKK02DRAFT_42336 [Dioszegia hungarica]|uniref:Uncharacterized protein n=1 Tax=Dioszegia hungarica TaxID=4972 RepID=A0AA38HCJ9_9TREE|nr:uncharacterized protein MKK02DRAFT_42336 [Dioszegia hungarica]KAI9637955.1 hypothetical protein MKK02DRAFT_42336 [Dioszegia hungarica]
MGLFDSSPSSSSTPNTAHGVNDIPAPRSDATVNAPPADQHRRVADFVKEVPNAKYVFDSRRGGENPEAELCRVTPQGGKSCIKVFMQSTSLFKSMQALDYFCALPAEPSRTHMECTRIPR